MSPTIHPLPQDVVHLIAAGEVIDSLTAAVRELVENALDAGATRITVSLWAEQWKLRVVDNGAGMALADLQQAAIPHSTSKIRNQSDLWNVRSLGFRGEALHSLAQLADLEICSRAAQSVDGWWVRYDHWGHPVACEVVAIAPGTVVTAHHLFGNWLPRRQTAPPLTQQLRSLQRLIYHLALCHPQVTWQVEQGDRPWFSIWAGTTAQDILPQILRDVAPTDLQALSLTLPEALFKGEEGRGEEIKGKRGKGKGLRGEEVRGERVKGKGVKGEGLREEEIRGEEIKGEEEGIQEKDEGGSQQEGLDAETRTVSARLELLIGLPDRCHRHRPDWVNVAVNGRMVRLPELEQTMMGAFRRTLPRDRHPVCFLHLQVDPSQVDWNRHPAKSEVFLKDLSIWQRQVVCAIDQTLQLSASRLPDGLYRDRVHQLLKTGEAAGHYDNSSMRETASSQENAPSFGEPIAKPSELKAIAQVHNRYILAEHPTGIRLIEQHIAHERVIYEQLCDRWQLVSLELPLLLHHLAPAQVEQLQRIGLEIVPFGEQIWMVRTAPSPLAQREDCTDALLELSLGGDLESALVATACRTAIRNGTPLTLSEMQSLLDRWQQTRNPRTCPHGRPICLSLEETSLSRFFRRHWVIGKSHGISVDRKIF